MQIPSAQFGVLAERIFAITLVILGCVVARYGWSYGPGQLNDIGPGAFPLGLGICLALLGLRCAWEARAGEDVERKLAAVVFMLPGIVLWALLVDRFGLVVATAALLLFCLPAEPALRPRGALLLFIFLCVAGWLVFIEGFRLPLTLLGG